MAPAGRPSARWLVDGNNVMGARPDGWWRDRRAATRRLTDALESVSKRGLHLLNLPAGTDIRRVREQLARMDRRLLQISKELEQLERARDAGHD